MLVNAKEEDYEIIELFGEPALFTCLRIDPETVPEGIFKYDVRHDDDCQGIPCELARYVMVNHWGTVLTNKEIDLGEDGFIPLNEEDFNYTGEETTLDEYIREYGEQSRSDRDEGR